MRGNALIDTGAILALLDRRDRWHDVCVEAFGQLRLPLVTSEAVLTELFHLVGDSRVEMEAAWRFVRTGAIVLATIENAELRQVQALMSRYWPELAPSPNCAPTAAVCALRVNRGSSIGCTYGAGTRFQRSDFCRCWFGEPCDGSQTLPIRQLPPRTQVVEIQNRVEDQEITAFRFGAPEGVVGEQYYVALAEWGIDDSGMLS